VTGWQLCVSRLLDKGRGPWTFEFVLCHRKRSVEGVRSLVDSFFLRSPFSLSLARQHSNGTSALLAPPSQVFASTAWPLPEDSEAALGRGLPRKTVCPDVNLPLKTRKAAVIQRHLNFRLDLTWLTLRVSIPGGRNSDLSSTIATPRANGQRVPKHPLEVRPCHKSIKSCLRLADSISSFRCPTPSRPASPPPPRWRRWPSPSTALRRPTGPAPTSLPAPGAPGPRATVPRPGREDGRSCTTRRSSKCTCGSPEPEPRPRPFPLFSPWHRSAKLLFYFLFDLFFHFGCGSYDPRPALLTLDRVTVFRVFIIIRFYVLRHATLFLIKLALNFYRGVHFLWRERPGRGRLQGVLKKVTRVSRSKRKWQGSGNLVGKSEESETFPIKR